MENNLVELKFDRVNEYFERFKKEYDAEYERNKTSGTRKKIPYYSIRDFVVRFVILSFIEGIIITTSLMIKEVGPNTYNSQNPLASLVNTLLSWIVPVSLIVALALLLQGVISLFSNAYEITIEYTRNEYYHKIKSKMLNKLHNELHNSITERMLIFDTNGMIVAPNLSTNENRKIFGEAEKRLNQNGK